VEQQKGRVLGIDFGIKRLGLAISDRSRMVAQGLAVYTRRDLQSDLVHIKVLVAEHEIAQIVLGLPVNMDGSLGSQAQLALEFKKQLEAELQIPIELFDERLTTAEAERVLLSAGVRRRKRRDLNDQLSAILILQGYLDQQRR
jgi:putative Holliday junction resolvase